MRSNILILLTFSVLAACNSREPAPLSEARKKEIVDSIVRERTKEIREMEEERLRDLMSLELKVRTDSLLALKRPAPISVPAKSDTLNGAVADTVSTLADSSNTINDKP